MAYCLVYSCLSFWIFQFIFCFLKFHLHRCPAFRCVISFFQGFCFCNSCLKFCCCDCFILRCFYNILLCCLEFVCHVIVSKCCQCNGPVSCSICSFRKCATKRICQSKLDSHCFVHPVICCKFCSISSFCICICAVISIVSPCNSLEI